jgi:hypothetical protein
MARITLAHGQVMALATGMQYSIMVMEGYLWISLQGDDILRAAGDSWVAAVPTGERIVIEALRGDACLTLIGPAATTTSTPATAKPAVQLRRHGP